MSLTVVVGVAMSVIRTSMKVFRLVACTSLVALEAMSQTNVSGTISTNTTWGLAGSPYIVVGDVTVNAGVTLTIDPGVQVRFNSLTDLIINGALVANGTVTDTILFTANSPSPTIGAWGGIRFNVSSISRESVLNNCVIQYGGTTNASGQPNCLVLDPRANPRMSNLTLRQNRHNSIGLIAGSYSQNILLDIVDKPYFTFGDISIGAGFNMTLRPGVILKFGATTHDLHVNGVLIADGKPDSLIVFTSFGDDSSGNIDSNGDGPSIGVTGDWGGIAFNQSSISTQSILNYCVIKYGGNANASANGNCVVLDPRANPQMSNLIMYNNRFNSILLNAGTFSQNLSLNIVDKPYIMFGDLTISAGFMLNIRPGVILKFGGSTHDMHINGALVANGKPDSLIIFTSAKDDSSGNIDSNGDGPSIGVTGDWGGIAFNQSSISTQSILNYCVIKYGGTANISGNANCLVLDAGANPHMSNLTLHRNRYNGILLNVSTTTQNIVLDIPSIPYVLTGSKTIDAGRSLTITPGCLLKSTGGVVLFIDGVLKSLGSSVNPVVLTSIRDDSRGGDTNNDGSSVGAGNDWGGIYFRNSSIDSSCVLQYTEIYFGGGASQNLNALVGITDASPKIQLSKFSSSGNSGIRCSGISAPDLGGGDHSSLGFNVFAGFLGTGRYAVYNDGPADFQARSNCWGTTDSLQINAIIFDRRDNATKGLVTYLPYRSSCDTTLTRPVSILSPVGGENWQVGTLHNITWSSSNITNLRIELSTDNGSTWPTLIVGSTPASTGSYPWTIPNLPSAQCRVRISDASNPSVFDISDAPFTIVGLPSTIVLTHGFQFQPLLATRWRNLKWVFSLADSVSPNRQICLVRHGRAYQTQLRFDGFVQLSDDALIDDIVAQHFSPNLTLDPLKDVVVIFDWAEESDRNTHGFAEAAADALAASLVEIARQFPWFLSRLHFVGHSRGAVVNSESVQRLFYFAANSLLPSGTTLDQNVHMTTLDPHPAGHWQGAYEAMNDDDVNSSNITYDGRRIGVVGWKSTPFKAAYIDNYYETRGTTGVPGFVFRGLDFFPGVAASVNIDGRLNNADPAHQLAHSWYYGTVNLTATTDEFNQASGLTIQRAQWYSPPPGEQEGFHFSRGRTADLTPIASVESQLKEVSEDATFGVDKLLFNGGFSLFSDLLGLPGWEKQGGGGNGHVDKYDGWSLNPHLELDQLNESRRHNLVYIPTNASFLNFRLRVRDRSNDDALNVYIGNSLVFVKPLLQTTGYQWETAVVPPTLRGTSTTINFVLDGQGFTDSEAWLDDVGFSRVARMIATVASPVFLHAYDAFGNHTGPTSDTTWVAEIPGSQYVFESDTLPHPHKAIVLPPAPIGTEYRFEIRSRNATGHFNFQIEDYTTGQQTLNVVFDSVAIQPNTVALCTVAVVSPTLPLSVDLDGNGVPDTTISATQYYQDFFLVATTGAHGSISPQDTVIRNYGDSLTFMIIPDSAYRVLDVLVDSVSVGPVSEYTFRNIHRNHTIHATFDLITSAQLATTTPITFKLHQNYPNPFNPMTALKYDLPVSGHVSLKVFNIVGQVVATLVDEIKPAGQHAVMWNPEGLASGVYLYRIQAGRFTQTRKLLLLR